MRAVTAQVHPIRAFVGPDVVRGILRARLSPAARSVAIALASRANAHGEAWPQTRRLADDAGLTPTSARRAVRELVACGLIEETELEPGSCYPNGRVAGAHARITRFRVCTAGEVAAAMKSAPQGAQAPQSAARELDPSRPDFLRARPVQTDKGQTGEAVRTDRTDPPILDRPHLMGRSRSEIDPERKLMADLSGSRAHASQTQGRAPGGAPSAYGAFRGALRAHDDGARGRRGTEGGRPPPVVTTTQPRREQHLEATQADRERAAASERSQVRRAEGDDDATRAACRALAAVRGPAESYPAAWVTAARARLAEGFTEAQLAAALAAAPRAPWYRDDPGRTTPGFVLASPDRVAALAAFGLQRAPAARIVRAAARAESDAETCAPTPAHENLPFAVRLLEAIGTTPDHARRPRQ